MPKKLIALLVVGFVLLPILTSAQTSADLDQISQILAQIEALKAKLAALQGAQTAQDWCHTFKTNLGVGSSNTSEVGYLQQALAKSGFSIDDKSEIGYYQGSISFGENTAAAVVAFQQKYGILTTGYVGQLTRTKLNSLYGCGSSSTTSSNTSGTQSGTQTYDSSSSGLNSNTSSLSVTYPAGGNSLNNGSGINIGTIRWTSSGIISSAGLDILVMSASGRPLPDGTYGRTIADNTPNTGSFVWQNDPQLPSGSYYIRITVHGNSSISGRSGTFSVVTGGSTAVSSTPSPSISILSPVYGQNLTAGTAFTFTWLNSSQKAVNISAVSAKDAAVSLLTPLVSWQSSDNQTWNWQVPNTQAATLTPGQYQIKICFTDGTFCSYSDYFNILPAQSTSVTASAPAITSLSPISGPAGTQVLITGTGFAPDSKVNFGSLAKLSGSVYTSGKEIVFNVPSGAQAGVTYPISVVNSNGTSGPYNFAVTAPNPPSIPSVWDVDGNGKVEQDIDGKLIVTYLFGLSKSALSPYIGSGATRNVDQVVAYLDGLKSGGWLDADGNGKADALSDGILINRYMGGWTGTSLTDGALGAGATRTTDTAIISYLNQAKSTSAPAPVPPSITTLSPYSGVPGTQVLITGTGFAPDSKVVFGSLGQFGGSVYTSGKEIVFNVPSNAVAGTTYQVSVTNTNGTSGPYNFAVTAPNPPSIPSVWDVDGNGKVEMDYDGKLVVAYILNATTINPAYFGAGATRATTLAVNNYMGILKAGGWLDADGNGKVDAFTDGILIGRYIGGWTGTSLTDGAMGAGATRTAAADIIAYLNSAVFNPSAALAGDVDGNGTLDIQDVNYLINYLFANGPAPKGNADANGDGVVTAADVFYLINKLSAGSPRGDANGDGVVNTADVNYIINYLFANGPAPKGNADANGDGVVNAADQFFLINMLNTGLKGDANGDGVVNVADLNYLINYFFANGPAPKGDGDANNDGSVNTADIFYLINNKVTASAAGNTSMANLLTSLQSLMSGISSLFGK